MQYRYPLTEAHREAFTRDGYVVLSGFLADAELESLEVIYGRFLRGEVAIPGRDHCDMAAAYEDAVPEGASEFALVNIMLPRQYYPTLRRNVYELRALATARELCGADMALDYDQLVAKPPRREDARFHWHQDLAYWPATSDTRTATFWLALDDCDLDNGCVQFVAGSHREPALRPHRPLHGDRDRSHTLVTEVDEAAEAIRPAKLRRGDVTVHHERVVHGSGGNRSNRWRRGYVVAFRAEAAVREERAQGFTHSHNDDLDVLGRVGDRRALGADGSDAASRPGSA